MNIIFFFFLIVLNIFCHNTIIRRSVGPSRDQVTLLSRTGGLSTTLIKTKNRNDAVSNQSPRASSGRRAKTRPDDWALKVIDACFVSKISPGRDFRSSAAVRTSVRNRRMCRPRVRRRRSGSDSQSSTQYRIRLLSSAEETRDVSYVVVRSDGRDGGGGVKHLPPGKIIGSLVVNLERRIRFKKTFKRY